MGQCTIGGRCQLDPGQNLMGSEPDTKSGLDAESDRIQAEFRLDFDRNWPDFHSLAPDNRPRFDRTLRSARPRPVASRITADADGAEVKIML